MLRRTGAADGVESSSVKPLTAWSPDVRAPVAPIPSSSTTRRSIAHGTPSASVFSGPGASMSVAVRTDAAQIWSIPGSLELKCATPSETGAFPPHE